MEFKEFKEILQKNFANITKDTTHLFEVSVDMDEMWELYQSSYPEGTNMVFRERREMDCSCCKNFIRNIGNVVLIENGKITTIWDVETGSATFQPVMDALSNYVKSKTIKDVWVNKIKKLGVNNNFEKLENGTVTEWHHFYLELPNKFVDHSGKSEADVKGTLRTTRDVFKRSLDEISEDSLLTVLEIIAQNSLYKGEEWRSALNEFYKYKKKYDELETDNEKDVYAWENSVKAGGAIGRIKNHSMGTLLINISEGVELDLAVKKYEQIVDPENYKRSKPVYSQKMLDDAKKTLEQLGYLESLPRRHADLEDITVNNILFSNKDSAKTIGGLDVFGEMSSDIAVNPKKFSKVEEVSIDKFVSDILPTAKEIEVLLENKHASNMVSLIAPVNKDAKSMFKWDNPFSWAYSGNMTDSSMKENVKSAGGKVDGVLRFSIQWNDNEFDGNDLDAHCIEPHGNEIYYGDKRNYDTTGQLDVDITHPRENTPAVENITWTNRSRMNKGTYKFYVNNFANRGGKTGFSAEIEFDGQVHSFDYSKELKNKEKILVAEVIFDGENFSIVEKLPSSVSSREVWGLKTNQFVPVSVVSYSSNYWNEQQGIGNKHFMFFLKSCINPEQPNGFYNEFLNQELNPHRKVMEALSSKLSVESVDNQLSGLGFSSTKRDELIVKVTGKTERVLKIKF